MIVDCLAFQLKGEHDSPARWGEDVEPGGWRHVPRVYMENGWDESLGEDHA